MNDKIIGSDFGEFNVAGTDKKTKSVDEIKTDFEKNLFENSSKEQVSQENLDNKYNEFLEAQNALGENAAKGKRLSLDDVHILAKNLGSKEELYKATNNGIYKNLAGGSLLAIERQIEFNNAANNESGVEVFEPVEQPANEETPVKNKNIDEKLQNVLDNFLNEDIKKEYNSSRKDAINVREKLEAACKEAGINDFRNAWKALHQYVGDEGHH